MNINHSGMQHPGGILPGVRYDATLPCTGSLHQPMRIAA